MLLCLYPRSKSGECDVNTFRGISLISLVGTVVCKILENRLSIKAEEKAS